MASRPATSRNDKNWSQSTSEMDFMIAQAGGE
jgi:hypothetical protein